MWIHIFFQNHPPKWQDFPTRSWFQSFNGGWSKREILLWQHKECASSQISLANMRPHTVVMATAYRGHQRWRWLQWVLTIHRLPWIPLVMLPACELVPARSWYGLSLFQPGATLHPIRSAPLKPWCINSTQVQWRINAQASRGCSLGAYTDQGPLIGQGKNI